MSGIMTKKVLACFKKFDQDGNGKISRGELASTLCALNPASFSDDAKVNALMDQVDTNKDGEIDYEEFVVWMMGGSELTKTTLESGSDLTSVVKDPAGYLFTLIDQNEDDTIDEEEWEKWLEVVLTDAPDLEEHLDFEVAKAGGAGEDEEEDEEKEEVPFNKDVFRKWIATLEAEASEFLFRAGTLAGKILTLQTKFPEAPQAAIREALRKKMGSTTSAAMWLEFCEKKGRWDCEDEEEEDDE